MSKAVVKNAGNTVKIVASAAISSGDFVQVGTNGELGGIAEADAASGAEVLLCVRYMADLAKATGVTFAVGSKVYWDSSNSRVTATSTNNAFAGYVLRANQNADTTVRVAK